MEPEAVEHGRNIYNCLQFYDAFLWYLQAPVDDWYARVGALCFELFGGYTVVLTGSVVCITKWPLVMGAVTADK